LYKQQIEKIGKEKKLGIIKFDEILKDRYEELKKILVQARSLQLVNAELTYFIELEKEKSEELQTHYNTSLTHLKKHNSHLAKHL
jgi:hypothetical protein